MNASSDQRGTGSEDGRSRKASLPGTLGERRTPKVLSTALGIALLAGSAAPLGAAAAPNAASSTAPSPSPSSASSNVSSPSPSSASSAAAASPVLSEWSTEAVKAFYDPALDWNLPEIADEPAEATGAPESSGAPGSSGSSAVSGGGGATVVHSGFGWDDLMLYHLIFNRGGSYSSAAWGASHPAYNAATGAAYTRPSYDANRFQNRPTAGSTVRPKTSSDSGSITRRSTSASKGSIGGNSSGFSSSGSSSSHSSGGIGGFGG